MKSIYKKMLLTSSLFLLCGCTPRVYIQAFKTAGLGSYKVNKINSNLYSVNGKGTTFDVLIDDNGNYFDNYESSLLDFALMEYSENDYEIPFDVINYEENGLSQTRIEIHYASLDDLNNKEEQLKEFIDFVGIQIDPKISYIYNTGVEGIENFVSVQDDFTVYRRDLKQIKQTYSDAYYFLNDGKYLNEVSYSGLYNLLIKNGFNVEGDNTHFKYTFKDDVYEFGYDLGETYLKNGNVVNCRKKLNYFNVGEVSGIKHE